MSIEYTTFKLVRIKCNGCGKQFFNQDYCHLSPDFLYFGKGEMQVPKLQTIYDALKKNGWERNDKGFFCPDCQPCKKKFKSGLAHCIVVDRFKGKKRTIRTHECCLSKSHKGECQCLCGMIED